MEILYRSGATLVIGETHGATELVQAYYNLVCNVAITGAPTIFTYEMSDVFQPRIDEYLASDGGASARQQFLQMDFWHPSQAELFDGRASAALVDLIDKMRALRAAGKDVRFVAHTAGPPGGDYDRAQALGIQRVRQSNPDAVVISVMGNNHARLDKPFATGALLRSWAIQSVNLNWAAYDPEESGSRMFIDRGRQPRIIMDRSVAFDGFLYVVSVHDSLPAFPFPTRP
jgi:hypothetical protein